MEKDINIHAQVGQKSPIRLNVNKTTLKHYTQTVKSQRQRGNHERKQKVNDSDTQGSYHMPCIRLLNRNLTGQERAGWYFQSAEGEKPAIKNTAPIE